MKPEWEQNPSWRDNPVTDKQIAFMQNLLTMRDPAPVRYSDATPEDYDAAVQLVNLSGPIDDPASFRHLNSGEASDIIDHLKGPQTGTTDPR